MYESQAKKLFIKKSDIENALDISLDGIPTKKFSFMENKSNQLAALEDYLKPYALMDRFTLDESIALLLGEYPDNPNSDIKYHYLYDSIRKLLKREIENGNLNNLGGITETSIDISHSELEQWAKRNSYKWILPPYNLLTTNQNQEQKDLNTQEKDRQIAELQNRIAELEKENEQLKNSVLVKNVVDYDEYSIYGHSTPAIEAVFGTIKRFWVNADVTQPDTVANVDVIEEWIDENYSVSKTIKEAIQKITRPEKARSLGRKS